MRVFNRIVVVLLLAGLVALGVFTALYGFGLFGYRLGSLSGALDSINSGLQGFVGGVESGSAVIVAVLVAIAVTGLILLVMELGPTRPRHVRLGKGMHLTRGAVRDEVTEAAARTPGVLGSSAKVKTRRKPGAKVKLAASVRRGEETGTVKSNLQENVRQHLSRRGVPTSKLKVKVNESDPRQSTARAR